LLLMLVLMLMLIILLGACAAPRLVADTSRSSKTRNTCGK
jgi:hypothetical protein